jgi:hypothetical protein
MSLATTRSTLMHAVLAHVSPELREFDLIAFGVLRMRTLSRALSLSSMPTEILLLIRSHLLPVLITHLIATSAVFLQSYEASLRHLICPQCTFYNEYVYGIDVWSWQLSGPCACTPHEPHMRRPNPKQFRDRHHWLESHLSHQSLGFRGLSASSAAIWDLVADVLGSFGCEAVRRSPNRRRAGIALLSRCDRQAILVVPLSHQKPPGKDHCNTTSTLFRRLDRDLGLSCDYNELRQSLPHLSPLPNLCSAVEIPASTHLPCNTDVTALILRSMDTITAPFAAVLSLVLSFVTLLFTVLCYYSKPRVLRAF